jgi:predicted O-methyltransferase YrrM
VKSAYGVDITNYTPSNSNIIMNVMTTDTFSEIILPTLTYDYAFIDADHSSHQVLKDFEHIYKYINKGGYIFLHDTYPCLEQMLASDYCNDCYKSPLLIRGIYPDIQMLTLPLNPGITIIHKS